MKRSNEEYIQLVDMAFDIFNQQMDADYSRENVEVKLITAKTADKDIAEFIKRYPEACEEQMLEPGDYSQLTLRISYALTGDRTAPAMNGIMIKCHTHKSTRVVTLKNFTEDQGTDLKMYCSCPYIDL